MSVLEALLLGIIQGVTEFLPISSSAHLVLLPKILGIRLSSHAFDTSLHLGTVLAVLVYFYKDLIRLGLKMWSYILIASIPVFIFGAFFDNAIESYFRTPWLVVFFLIAGSLYMLLAEKVRTSLKGDEELTFPKILWIGISQVFALFSGVSRSGVTISTGLLLNLKREQAARFSFLLSTPAVIGAAAYKLTTSFDDILVVGYDRWLVGLVGAFVAGALSIHFLIGFLKTKSLLVFAVYRIIFALLMSILLLLL